MNKLDERSSALTVPSLSIPNFQPVRRLIVLIPSLEVDVPVLTRRVWKLADAASASVQFLGLYSNATQEPGLRRELVTMSAMVKDERISTEADAVFSKDWVDVVKTRSQAGDLIVCFAEHRVGLQNRPLSQVLQSELNVPLYIISGLYPPKNVRSNWSSQVAAWAGSIAIVFGFSFLQARMDYLSKDWTQTALLMISILIEFWAIWSWNSLLG